MTGTHLITTDNWFFAPDGKSYRSVWGNVVITDDSVLGIKTNARSSNWFAKVGSDDNYVIIAGCQIHYAVKCDKPNINEIEDFNTESGECKKYIRPTLIYIAE